MRVNQAIFPTSVFTNTDNTANALYGFICGATVGRPDELIDDHWGMSSSPPLSNKITLREGMVFWAKDGMTLGRGFSKVASKQPKNEWSLSGGNFNITIAGLTWDLGSTTHQSKPLIAMKTVGHNIGLVFNPIKAWRIDRQEVETAFGKGTTPVKVTKNARPYQSVMKNMQKADPEELLVQRGAAILVVQTDKMKMGVQNGKQFRFSNQYGHWGKEFRQIGATVDMATLSSLVNTLL